MFPADLGMVYRYLGESYTSGATTWPEATTGATNQANITSNATKVTNTANTFGASKPVVAVRGTIATTITFPTVVAKGSGSNTEYTFFYVARYTATSSCTNRNRIFSSLTGNWLSGFWSCTAGTAFHEGWLADANVSVSELGANGSASGNNWLLGADCGYTATAGVCSASIRAFGKNRTTISNTNATAHQVVVNSGAYTETSDFEIAEVISYPTNLTVDNVIRIENYLASKYGISLSSAAASKLAIHRNSTGSVLGRFFETQPQVAIQDSNGTLVTSDNSTVVTATITGPSGFAVGIESATALRGIATFSNLGIQGYSGNNYTITYTANTGFTSTSETRLFTGAGLSETDSALTMIQTNDVATQYAYVNHTPDLVLSNSFTIEAWVRPTSFNSGGWSMVINKELSYELGITSSAGSGVGYWNYGLKGSGWSGVNTGVKVALNEWHHIALSRASGSEQVRFYLDGFLAYTGLADGVGTGTISDSSLPLTIGARYNDGNGYVAQFKGQIDHVAIFNTVRAQSDIQSDMNTYNLSGATGLLAYYDFNESSGSTVYNRKVGTTSASDLTLVGSNLFTDVKVVDTATLPAYTIVKFPRTYLTSIGGWKVPANIPKVSALVVAGGGGGGSRAGGGGGAGGLVYRTVLNLTPNSVETITIGVGGHGGLSTSALTTHQGLNGKNSALGTHSIAIGGGGGGGAGEAGNTYRVGLDGGSGGGASGDSSGNGSSAAYGLSTQTSYGLGNRGGSGMSGTYWNGGGGGGSGAAGSHASTSSWVAGNGGAGTLDPVGGSNLCIAAGGGGGTIDTGATAGSGGSCASGVLTAGSGTKGSVIATSGGANSGSGGGGSGYSAGSDVAGGNGGSGIIIVRWITASKPTFTQPTNAYLNVGMTETFTLNVAQDSATVNLTRTFRWESTTGGSGGTYSLIKQGTGASNASFSWIPTDTSTSGSNYLYRVIVTDSDTAGLFIVDTSTAVYAVINRALSVSGTSGIAKTINVSKSETFTITLGTSTYRTTLTSNNPGISLDTTTATSPVVRIADTMTVGTYYETLTVIDSVSATIVTPLTIKVTPPPSFSFTSNVDDNGTVLYYDSGNSFSYPGTGTTWSDMSGRKLNASFSSAPWALSGSQTATCAAPSYSSDYQGILNFDGSTKCGYVSNTGSQTSFAIEFWIRTNGAQTDAASVLTTPFSGTSKINYACYFTNATTSLTCGMWNNGWSGQISTSLIDASWSHVVYTFDNANTTASLFVNGSLISTAVGAVNPGVVAGYDGILIGRRWDSAKFFKGDLAMLRIFSKPFSSADVVKNYDASKARFYTLNQRQLTPTQKYGHVSVDTYTVTSGGDIKTIALSNGNRGGLTWDTSTVSNQVSLRASETLSAGTYWETITVSDNLGAVSRLSVSMTVTKADTLTISMDTATSVVYNGSPITVYPKIKFTGLAGVDTLTASTRFTSATYTDSATVPTDADTYTVIAADPIFTVGALSNYLYVKYETSTAMVTQASQKKLSINLYGAVAGSPFLIQTSGGSGDGLVTESVTAGSTASGCTVTNHVLSNTSPSTQQVTCNILVTKAASKNYKAETLTVTVYFMLFVNNQPTNQVGSGSTIGLNGINSVWVDPGATPIITGPVSGSFNQSGLITITGSGFSLGPITIKFNRNQVVSGVIAGSDTSLTITIPAGATSGYFSLTNRNGTAVSPNAINILPAPTI